jgi:hypothetical protein
MQKHKSIPALKAELQLIFNKFIRYRDANEPCISCGKVKELQAGHYYSVKGYDGLRFDEMNVNGECSGCNCFDESHLIGYGENLKIKIGLTEYKKLCDRARQYKINGYKFTRSELMDKIDYYKYKVKLIE